MPKAPINGINLYYEDHGKGFPIIFTHGFAGTARSWEGQVAAFTRKYRFITYDMRGHSRTDAPDDASQYGLDTIVEDMHQLLRHLGVRRAVVGGLSLGGYLTIHFYHQHPEMTAAAILIDTGPGFRSPDKARAWNESRQECARILETKGMKGFMESSFSKDDYYTTPDVMLTLNPKGLVNINHGIMQNTWGLDLLPQMKVPTLVICGDRDTGFLAGTDYMAQKIPGAKKVVIPKAGHGVNIDQPRAFEKAVLDFLEGLKLQA